MVHSLLISIPVGDWLSGCLVCWLVGRLLPWLADWAFVQVDVCSPMYYARFFCFCRRCSRSLCADLLHPCVRLAASPFISPGFSLSYFSLSLFLSIHPFIHPSIYFSLCLSMCSFVLSPVCVGWAASSLPHVKRRPTERQ